MREELYLRQLKVLHRVLKNVRKKYQGNAGSPQIVDDLQQDMEKNIGRNDLCKCSTEPTSSKDKVSYKK